MIEDIDLRYQSQRRLYLTDKISHDDFYLWLSDLVGLTEGYLPVSLEKIRASKDPHLNDIPLSLWDGKHQKVRYKAIKAGFSGWALMDTVCCLKAIAHRAIQKGAKHE